MKNNQVIAIVGYQAGDEGKGRYSELLTEYCDVVTRPGGGPNAGHTVIGDNGKVYSFHLIPSGIIHDDKTFCMGPGMVIDPRSLVREINTLEKENISWENLYISGDAVVITPDLVFLDRAKEKMLGKKKIGTTGIGIGDAYASLVNRNAIRINDIRNKDVFKEKLENRINDTIKMYINPNRLNLFKRIFGKKEEKICWQEILGVMMKKDLVDFYDKKNFFNIDAIVDDYYNKSEKFKDNIRNVSQILNKAYKDGKRILLEGSQGVWLSVLHGTTRYTTSCSVGTGWLAEGAGFPAQLVDQVYGVIRCPIMNRVGNGPFPSEFGGKRSEEYCMEEEGYAHTKDKEIKEYPDIVELINNDDRFLKGIGYRIKSGNYGTTTTRPRRVGPIDIVALRWAIELYGPDLLVTHLDDCNDADKIEICTGYKYMGDRVENNGRIWEKGDTVDYFVIDSDFLYKCEPIIETMPGWKQDLSGIKNYNDLPPEARNLLKKVEELANAANIKAASFGSKRSDMVLL